LKPGKRKKFLDWASHRLGVGKDGGGGEEEKAERAGQMGVMGDGSGGL